MGPFRLGQYLMSKKKELLRPSALQQIAAIKHPAIVAPFGIDPGTGNDKLITIIARELSFVQIKSCGNFSLIETFQDKLIKKEKEKKELSLNDIVEYSELMHNLARLSLLSPTYDEIINTLLKYDNIDNIDEQLKEVKELFLKIKKDKERKEEAIALQEEYARIELQYKYVLPANFLNYIFCFALKIDSTDIKLVSEDMLYDAAAKASLGHDNPADHMPGMFSEFNYEDINDRGWAIYFNKKKEMEETNKQRTGAK